MGTLHQRENLLRDTLLKLVKAEKLPYSEDTPLEGRHPYDVSKSCADLITQAYAKTYGLPVSITRCGNFYGGGDLNWNRIVPGTIRSIVRGERPVIRSEQLISHFSYDYFALIWYSRVESAQRL